MTTQMKPDDLVNDFITREQEEMAKGFSESYDIPYNGSITFHLKCNSCAWCLYFDFSKSTPENFEAKCKTFLKNTPPL